MEPEESMAGRLPTRQKELLRGRLVETVKQGKMALKTVSIELKISYRQAKRIYKAYREGGDAVLIHGTPWFWTGVRVREDGGLRLTVSTLRRMLVPEGLWERKRRSREYRSRRERKQCFGERASVEAIQFDGSRRDRLGGRWPRRCLATVIDDAANTRLACFFEEETMFGAMTVLQARIARAS
jgi:hypothetical protein